MDISDIIGKVDILEYCSQYCDFEERNGEHWALSPFKEENTPSFSVNTEKQCFYDFSSGEFGNVLNFVKLYHRCNFNRALRILMEYANIPEHEIVGDYSRRESSYLQTVKKYKSKANQKKPVSYSKMPETCMESYEYDAQHLKSWIDEGISEQTLRHFGVGYDMFSNRIVYPVRSYSGDIVNIHGRTLDPDFKEKRIPKYIYYKPWGTMDTLYGFSDNKQYIDDAREIIVFEGAKSVMLAYEWGIKNSCAIMTSHMNDNQLFFLAKLGYSVVIAMDEDVDVLADKKLQKLKHYVNLKYIKDTNGVLEPKMSPVDAGEECFRKLLDDRRVFA